MSRTLPINDPYKLNVASKLQDIVIYKPENNQPVYYPKGAVKNGK